MEKVEPKLLTEEELIKIYIVYHYCGQIFEGSPILKLFGHIVALSRVNQKLLEVIVRRHI